MFFFLKRAHSCYAIWLPPKSGDQSHGAAAPPERRFGRPHLPGRPAPEARVKTHTASAGSCRRASSSPPRGKHGAVPAQQGGSHRKMRIGYIGKSMHGKRAGYQLPVGHIRSLLILGPVPSPGTCFLYYNACGAKPQARNARASLAAWLWQGKRFRPYRPLPRKARGPDQGPI